MKKAIVAILFSVLVVTGAAMAAGNKGQCMGDCASDQGQCIGGCNGDGQCIARCQQQHGRCVSRCH